VVAKIIKTFFRFSFWPKRELAKNVFLALKMWLRFTPLFFCYSRFGVRHGRLKMTHINWH
jgi:hypothetical protein